MSGGLDSSSIVCMAQKILNKDDKVNIDTYSLVFDDLPQVDERFFIDKVIEISDYIKPNYIHGDEINPLENIDTILWHEEEPFYTINMSLFWSLYNKMEKNKVRVVLGILPMNNSFNMLRNLIKYVQFCVASSWHEMSARKLRYLPDIQPHT